MKHLPCIKQYALDSARTEMFIKEITATVLNTQTL